MSTFGAAILLAGFVWPVDLADLVPGTYDVVVCAEPCESDAPTKPYARGALVLWDRDLDVVSMSEADRQSLLEQATFPLESRQKANACLVLELVDEGTPPVGRTLVALTRWSYSAGVLTVALDRLGKPSHAHGVFAGKSILGGYPEEARLRAVSPSISGFLSGTRTGGADPEVCLRATRRDPATDGPVGK